MSALASLEDVQAVSKPVPAAQRADVYRLIEMVSGHVRRYTGQTFDEATSTIVVRPHDGAVRLPQRPVTAVASIVIEGTTIDPSQYTAELNGVLTRNTPSSSVVDTQFWGVWAQGWSWPVDGVYGWPPLPMTVEYTHGYADGEVPAELSMVVAEKVAVKWLSGRRLAEGTQAQSIDGYSETFAHLAHVSAGNAWDPEHKDILDTFRPNGRAKFASVRIG